LKRIIITFFCSLSALLFLQSGIGLLDVMGKKKITEDRLLEIFKDHNDKAFGFDISSYQMYIDWEKAIVVRDTVQMSFVFMRATAGTNRLDKMFQHNWEKAREHNLVRGAYHYYRPDEDPKSQAEMFIKNVVLEKGDLPPVLDIENHAKTMPMASLKKNLRIWLEIVENHYGIKPIIYTGEDFHIRFLREDFAAYKFWVANYNPSVSYLEDDWLVWQFTDTVVVDGVVGYSDLNVFHGNKIDLLSHTIQQ
jgi:lysozyme